MRISSVERVLTWKPRLRSGRELGSMFPKQNTLLCLREEQKRYMSRVMVREYRVRAAVDFRNNYN